MILGRLRYYPPYLLVFGLAYGAVVRWYGVFPGWAALVILAGSLLKDVVDEIRLQRGSEPVAYATIEHSPSTIVVLALVAVEAVAFGAPIAGVDRETLAVGIGVIDLALDLSQDLRAG